MAFDDFNQDTGAAAQKFDNAFTSKLQSESNFNSPIKNGDKVAMANSSDHPAGCPCCVGAKLALDSHPPGCGCGCSTKSALKA